MPCGWGIKFSLVAVGRSIVHFKVNRGQNNSIYPLQLTLMTKARDFIKSDEHILVVFTEGMHFELSDGNTGVTGEWPVDPSHARSVDRVLVYHRNNEKNTNDLYIANRVRVDLSRREDRYNIQLSHVQYVGITPLNWHEFADTGAQPFRYLP